MSAVPPITVLMSVRNGQDFIEECLENVLGQTYADFRFLIVDNASTDGTPDAVRACRDSRIDLVTLDGDLGQSGALRHGLTLCRSEYVARTDVDDRSRRERLELQVAFLDKHPQVALLGSWYEVVDLTGHVLSVHRPATEHPEIVSEMLFRNQFAHSCVMYRREAALACGSYNPNYRHVLDYALWWNMIMEYRTANLPEFLVQICMHPGQFTREFSSELADEPFEMMSRILADGRLPPEAVGMKRRARGYAEMRYAAFLATHGTREAVHRYLFTGMARCPSLAFTRDGSYFIARSLLNKRLYGLSRGFRRWLARSR